MVIFKQNKKNQFNKGFTLVEVLVSVGIITVITSIVLFNYSTFNENLILSSNSREIAVAIRQAQIYGSSVKQSSVAGDYSRAYGIYANLDDPNYYYVFVDQNSDGKYTGISEIVEKIPLRNGVTISNICGKPFGGVLVCPAYSGARSVHVTFLRPNLDARVRFADSSGSLSGLYQIGRIVISTPKSNTKYISIEDTGQISLQ